MAERLLPKQDTRVRFPSSAPRRSRPSQMSWTSNGPHARRRIQANGAPASRTPHSAPPAAAVRPGMRRRGEQVGPIADVRQSAPLRWIHVVRLYRLPAGAARRTAIGQAFARVPRYGASRGTPVGVEDRQPSACRAATEVLPRAARAGTSERRTQQGERESAADPFRGATPGRRTAWCIDALVGHEQLHQSRIERGDEAEDRIEAGQARKYATPRCMVFLRGQLRAV